jgi:hypothetical protein
MRYHSYVIAVLAGVVAAGASSVVDYSSATADTILKIENKGTSSGGTAITGKSTRPNTTAIRGLATQGVSVGVHGQANGWSGIGVKGVADPVYGWYGVYGEGATAGLYGTSINGWGVWGTATQNGYAGVFGGSQAEGGVGLEGIAAVGIRARGTSAWYYASTGLQSWADASGSAYGYGVHTGASYGDYMYGIYSYTTEARYEGWAGFFDGNVAIMGDCYPCSISDEKLKKNVREMKGSLAKVMTLRPKSYEMKAEEYKSELSLGRGLQHGLIAQEVAAVFPEIVHPITAPARLSDEETRKGVKKAGLKTTGVNYVALIPVLIQAMQEQQAQIEAQRAEIQALKAGR